MKLDETSYMRLRTHMIKEARCDEAFLVNETNSFDRNFFPRFLIFCKIEGLKNRYLNTILFDASFL